MLRITAEVFPYGNKEQAKKVAQIDIANLGNDGNGNTQYLYSILEPCDLNGNSIDTSGMTKFKRQANIMGFLRKFCMGVDTGRELNDENKLLIEKMRNL